MQSEFSEQNLDTKKLVNPQKILNIDYFQILLKTYYLEFQNWIRVNFMLFKMNQRFLAILWRSDGFERKHSLYRSRLHVKHYVSGASSSPRERNIFPFIAAGRDAPGKALLDRFRLTTAGFLVKTRIVLLITIILPPLGGLLSPPPRPAYRPRQYFIVTILNRCRFIWKSKRPVGSPATDLISVPY